MGNILLHREWQTLEYKEYFRQEISDEEILRSFVIVMPYLNKLTRDDMAF